MVSTRGPRYKFCEGEKVLCYEPDPTKARVLYDSKVLEVIRNKDKRGRPVVEYLIHFQGWNSSWDRCVDENLVLKDTDENRQLQKNLAHKSRLQIGTYLYRRERKKTPSDKRPRKRGSEFEGSSESESYSRSDSSCTTAEERKPDSSTDPPAEASIALGPGLRERLELDFRLVTRRARLIRLPARPCVLDILEGCVKQYAAREAASLGKRRRSRSMSGAPDKPQEQMEELSFKLNLLHEIADGLRVYFDYLLNGHLLYRSEYPQYREAVCKNMLLETRRLRMDRCDENDVKSMIKSERQSPLEEYAHLPPSPKLDDSRDRNDVPVRRLRSHKLSMASETSEEPSHMGSNSSTPAGPSNLIDATSSSLSGSPGPADANHNCDTKGTVADIIQNALSWHIVPADHPPFPSAVYGATHLARLFVKLPEFLSAINMAEMKLKLIIKYIDIFVDYLEEHEEWFGELYYSEMNSVAS